MTLPPEWYRRFIESMEAHVHASLGMDDEGKRTRIVNQLAMAYSLGEMYLETAANIAGAVSEESAKGSDMNMYCLNIFADSLLVWFGWVLERKSVSLAYTEEQRAKMLEIAEDLKGMGHPAWLGVRLSREERKGGSV